MIVVHNPVGSPQNADHADCRLQTVQTDYFFLTLDSLFLVLLLPNSVQNVSMLLNTKRKIRPAMRTWSIVLSFIPFGWNAVLKYQYLGVELLQV